MAKSKIHIAAATSTKASDVVAQWKQETASTKQRSIFIRASILQCSIAALEELTALNGRHGLWKFTARNELASVAADIGNQQSRASLLPSEDPKIVPLNRKLEMLWERQALVQRAYQSILNQRRTLGRWLADSGVKNTAAWYEPVMRSASRAAISESQAQTLQTWVTLTVAFLLALVTLEWLSIPLTIFAFLAGALAISVGFGTQTIIKNFISGIILLFERKVRVGDNYLSTVCPLQVEISGKNTEKPSIS